MLAFLLSIAHAAEPRVALRFGWPAGMRCEVDAGEVAPPRLIQVDAVGELLRVSDGASGVVVDARGAWVRGEGRDTWAPWTRLVGMWAGLDVPASTFGSAVGPGPRVAQGGASEPDWFYRYHFATSTTCPDGSGGRCHTLVYEADAFGPAAAGATLRGELVLRAQGMIPVARDEELRVAGAPARQVRERWSCALPVATAAR